MVDITYHKVYDHPFDSIGGWWVFRWNRATGVRYPWGVLPSDLPLLFVVDSETSREQLRASTWPSLTGLAKQDDDEFWAL